MAFDCKDVPANLTYSCESPWGQNCESNAHFQFTTLWKYTQSIQNACATDSRLFIPPGGIASPQNASLTQASCTAIAGSDWKYYPAADIWTRLTTWKFPLLQLVASFPRPPLSLWVDCFVIIHLLGDPIDTIKNLLVKMSTCQRGAEYWRGECEKYLERPEENDKDRNWKALAFITDAYGEWDADEQAMQALQQGLCNNPKQRNDLARTIRQTGRALAADRSTKFLPIIVAQAFFIGAIGIAIFRTASAAGANASSDTVFINVEAHSIAFSALYFWIIPAVFLGSTIGVSQTEAAIPRILRRFQVDIEHLELPSVTLPNDRLENKAKRVFYGGVYSWQPQKRRSSRKLMTCHYLSYLVVIMGTVTGMMVSALVPPDGWDCRHIGEILILFAWLLSARTDVMLSHLWPSEDDQSKLFWTTGTKDLLITIATMGGVITTQLGVFNRCSCYTLWGKIGLALPEMPEIAETLFHRLNTAYPAITFTSIGIELIVVPLFICIQYIDALRTYVQRDDRESNAAWLWKSVRKLRDMKAALRGILPRSFFRLSRANRTNTLIVEEGPPGESEEMQPLAPTLSEEPDSIAAEDGGAMGTTMANAHPEPMDPVSQSSGVDTLSRSGTDLSSASDGRRRNTERQHG